MKPVNLATKLAAAETELACLKMALAQVKEDRDELRQSGTTGAGRPRCSAPRSSSPRSSERLMSGASLPRSGARGGVGWRAKAQGATVACCVSPPFHSA